MYRSSSSQSLSRLGSKDNRYQSKDFQKVNKGYLNQSDFQRLDELKISRELARRSIETSVAATADKYLSNSQNLLFKNPLKNHSTVNTTTGGLNSSLKSWKKSPFVGITSKHPKFEKQSTTIKSPGRAPFKPYLTALSSDPPIDIKYASLLALQTDKKRDRDNINNGINTKNCQNNTLKEIRMKDVKRSIDQLGRGANTDREIKKEVLEKVSLALNSADVNGVSALSGSGIPLQTVRYLLDQLADCRAGRNREQPESPPRPRQVTRLSGSFVENSLLLEETPSAEKEQPGRERPFFNPSTN